jgi:hypothetical protein
VIIKYFVSRNPPIRILAEIPAIPIKNFCIGKWVVKMGDGWNWLRIVFNGRLWY